MRRSLVFSLVLLAALLGGLDASAGRRPVFVTGAGTLDINGSLRNFAFNAHMDREGNVRGQGELHNRDQGVRRHLVVNCLDVQGNVATMSGLYTHSSDEGFIDREIWFRVVDNGNGPDAPPDEITLVWSYITGGPTCHDENPLAELLPIRGGQITIHD